MKYKNEDGVELNYTGNDLHTALVKEVVSEAIKILEDINPHSIRSRDKARFNCIDFLKENFSIESDERSDEWRINQFNRNRSIEDQVSTIEELEERVNEIFNS